jgi:hypothetical protein
VLIGSAKEQKCNSAEVKDNLPAPLLIKEGGGEVIKKLKNSTLYKGRYRGVLIKCLLSLLISFKFSEKVGFVPLVS